VGDHQGFSIVLRGYDIGEVEEAMERVRAARVSLDPVFRATVRRELTNRSFRIRLRGYDRAQVDEYFRQAVDRLA
jgi:DivIVA domain-containing protein